MKLQRFSKKKWLHIIFDIEVIILPILLALTSTDIWKTTTFFTDEQKSLINNYIVSAVLIGVILYFLFILLSNTSMIDDINNYSYKPLLIGADKIAYLMRKINNITRNDIHRYLDDITKIAKRFIHPNISFIDIMKLFKKNNDVPIKYLLNESSHKIVEGWLEICNTNIQRSTESILIPIMVNQKPWPGAGESYISKGIIYVDRFVKRLELSKYNIGTIQNNTIRNQYQEWEKEHSFASIISIAIPCSLEDDSSCGVLNLNFKQKYPFGKKKSLNTEDRERIEKLLSPHLLVISSIINRGII